MLFYLCYKQEALHQSLLKPEKSRYSLWRATDFCILFIRLENPCSQRQLASSKFKNTLANPSGSSGTSHDLQLNWQYMSKIQQVIGEPLSDFGKMYNKCILDVTKEDLLDLPKPEETLEKQLSCFVLFSETSLEVLIETLNFFLVISIYF